MIKILNMLNIKKFYNIKNLYSNFVNKIPNILLERLAFLLLKELKL